MDLNSGVSLGQLLLALASFLVATGITWGGLLQRVKTLEKEVEALSGFAVTLATMQSEIGHIKSGIEQITSSWLFREPPTYGSDVFPRPKPPTRRKP